ncbi:2-oxoacid:acceptor oxidoreductase family protein [Ramlibacter sp.]|uniref:2-oxoacid:acceptor oxidoreductase family protein n=1 Tax=Ramlibacter sp. TaxID=1917967 RepID=UPI002B6F56B5|nr:2-oxoacid:acceptor oxidoreductase family protein [Ramlibacter sp.]HWI82988.1 2-oxoacid:acceptor oxidoreductase family protein [Ramlibacter sp.]
MTTAGAHREAILAGSGGQGLVLSAILLAEAAMLEGRNVVQTQSYGIASRGGLSFAEVIIDEAEIVFQQVRRPDCVLALTEEAAAKFGAWAASGVPVFYDSTLARGRDGAGFHGCPFTQRASELGQVGSVNILALGTLAARTGIVGMSSLEQAVRRRFAGAAGRQNVDLLAAGAGLAVA